MASVVETLKAARKRIERGWCQGQQAVDGEGSGVAPHDDDAVAWCLVGSTAAERSAVLSWAADDVLHRVLGRPLVCWNDEPGRTQADVLALFDHAISLAEAEAQR